MGDVESRRMWVPGDERRVERSAHAIYGLIIITSTLVMDRIVAEDWLTSLLVVWGAGIVLVLAHLYSALVAEVGSKGRFLSHAERHVLIVDNAPVLAAVVAPTLLLLAVGLGWLELLPALDVAVAICIVALFMVGAVQVRKQGAGLAVRLGLGLLGGAIGIIVVALEVALSH